MFRTLVVLAAIAAVASAEVCSNPEVSTESFSVGDSTLFSQTSYLVDFSVKCDGDDFEESLFALVDGTIVPVPRDEEGNYQVSWSHKHKDSISGSNSVKIFDAEGATAAAEALENSQAVTGEAFTVSGSFSETIKVDLPVATEYIFMAVGVYVIYFLNGFMSK